MTLMPRMGIMSNPFAPRIGGILSADIAVPEHERVVSFYARVLTTGERPLWRDDLMNDRGRPIIGLGARNEEYADLPLQWMPHIQVADVAASVERALDLGGRELIHGKDDAGASQWAVLLDPNGAAFGIIPVVPAEAMPPMEGDAESDDPVRVGRIAWLDLTVPGAAATRDFYQQVVGWSVQDVAMKDAGDSYADYNMLGDDGDPAAGICHARGVNLGLPPVWMIYLPVGDLDESLRRVEEGGGTVVKATQGADGRYAYAVIQDPVGACLALVAG
jgi:predicted enzyme related to lactoylglutathione lyase